MMYPFMTIDNDTEITHSEMKEGGSVKVYIETPDEEVCFKHATCYLPEYRWEGVFAYTEEEMERIKDVVESTAHLIISNSQFTAFEIELESLYE